MLPHRQGKRLYKTDVLELLKELDSKLEGMQRKVRLYGLGGTVLILTNVRDSSKDVDFIVSLKDFRALSGHVAELEKQKNVRIDLFPDGDLPDYKYEVYTVNAQKAPLEFKNIELYYLDKADFVLTKALAGRPDDFADVAHFTSSDEVPLDVLRSRYEKVRPDPEKNKILQSKFEKFIEEFYKKK